MFEPGMYPHKIMLVDDAESEPALFKFCLQNAHGDIQFIYAQDSQSALAILNQHIDHLPEIVFIDINMPELDGFQLLALLKDVVTYRSITFVMYSVGGRKVEIENAKRLGANWFLEKPPSLWSMMEAMKFLLSNYRRGLSEFSLNIPEGLHFLSNCQCT